MIYQLNDNATKDNVGNKAKALMEMTKKGFSIPGGIVLSSNIFTSVIKYNRIDKEIDSLLYLLAKENLKEISIKISNLFDSIIFPEKIINKIEEKIDMNKSYAVRSSGTKEDLENYSFAGQYHTFLNRNGMEEIKKAIIGCYKSMYTEVMLSYLIHNGVEANELEMAVIIQEMVDSDISGIAFTMNPITGIDKEVVIEVAEGLGENIVSGKVVPERYIYNWYEEKFQENRNQLLDKKILLEMMETFLEIGIYFGYPCDIEFAIKDNKLYILQARAITKITYSGIQDQWTTADFKDGGVSSTVCYPFMWSLYEYIWEISYRNFLNESMLLRKKDMQKLGELFYGRPYWNLSKAKQAMAKVIGYKEREFDHSLGVKITYTGDGVVTKLNIVSIINVIRIYLKHLKLTKLRLKNNLHYKDHLLDIYNGWLQNKDDKISINELEEKVIKLIFEDYLFSESTYFSQIFINTVGQSIYKESLTKTISEKDYLNLLVGLNDISHLRPFEDLWLLSRKIRNEQKALVFWKNSSIKDILDEYYNNSYDYFIPELIHHIEEFGYHSDKELDVTYPHYLEEPTKMILTLKEIIEFEDHHHVNNQEESKKVYLNSIEKIKKSIPPRRFASFIKKVEEMRNMLWWREEFRDISTRFYFLIRLYILKLAREYVKEDIIFEMDDIWYLKINHLKDYIEKKISKEELHRIMDKNKKYYHLFKNYTSENEIGHIFDKEGFSLNSNGELKGVGCNHGVVTGKAKVIHDFSEIDKIESGDILITKFTDTGWTSKFAILKGIITEYGGVLCHAAIVSREYGIPCIVCANGITTKIKNGSTITINGATGEIKIIKE